MSKEQLAWTGEDVLERTVAGYERGVLCGPGVKCMDNAAPRGGGTEVHGAGGKPGSAPAPPVESPMAHRLRAS